MLDIIFCRLYYNNSLVSNSQKINLSHTIADRVLKKRPSLVDRFLSAMYDYK